MMSAIKSFNEYNNELKERFINDSHWDELKKSSNITLLLGAGVTSCLVGNWNELLNELAVLRVVSGSKDMTPEQLLDYLARSCNRKFLPEDTSTLEKGEYLRYCITDRLLFDSKDENGKWREIVFAGRVAAVVQRLIKRHLCDGAGRETESNYKDDFLKWCKNTETEPFALGRRVLSESESSEAALNSFSTDEISQKLNDYYGIRVDPSSLCSLIGAGTENVNDIYKMFESLYKDRSGEECRKKIKSILQHKDMAGKSKTEQTKIFLKKIAAFLLWRPSYNTLETMLSMCINRKVRNVITYNFDTIFDRLLIDEEVQRALLKDDPFTYQPVRVFGIKTYEPLEWIGCGKAGGAEAICVHHVHGIVDNEMDRPEPIIFSETAYYSYQQLSLNLGSMQIADAYYKGSLLCVGFSGADSNFRGIIRQMNLLKNAPVFDDGKKHSIFLTRSLDEITKYYGINEDMKEMDYSPAFLCAYTYLEMLKYYYMNEVEVTILWAPGYKEMNESLQKVYSL